MTKAHDIGDLKTSKRALALKDLFFIHIGKIGIKIWDGLNTL